MSTSSHYLGYRSWFVKEIGVELPEFELDGYDVAMLVQPITTGSTKICHTTSNIAEIKVNDTVLGTVSTGHTFSEVGKWNVVRIKYTDGVTSIPSSGFSGCTRIYEVKIADSITSIGDYAFNSCSGLTSVEIGSGCTRIGMYAFRYCSKLEEIICHNITAPTLTYYSLDGIKSYGTLYVPNGTNYGSWMHMNANDFYLGYYNWTLQYIS